jgi:hypothetical protein
MGDSPTVRGSINHLISPIQGLGLDAGNGNREEGCREKRRGDFHTRMRRKLERFAVLLKIIS